MIFAKQKSEAHYSLFYSFLTLIQFALNRFLNIANFYWKRMRGDQAESFPWDMRRFAPSVMGPAALATGFALSRRVLRWRPHRQHWPQASQRLPATGFSALTSATGHASSSVARATGLAALPVTAPSALSSAVNSNCKDLAWEASCPSGKTNGKKKAAPDDDR